MVEEEAVLFVRELEAYIGEEDLRIHLVPKASADAAASLVDVHTVFPVRQPQRAPQAAQPRPDHGDPPLLRGEVVAVRLGIRRIRDGRFFEEIELYGSVDRSSRTDRGARLVAVRRDDRGKAGCVREETECGVESAPLHPRDEFAHVQMERTGRGAERLLLLHAAILYHASDCIHRPIPSGDAGSPYLQQIQAPMNMFS